MGDLDRKEREALRYVRQIETLVGQIGTGNVTVAGLTASNPSAAAEMFAKNKAKFEKHPGLKREKGHVGFQSYNVRIEFKNIMLKPL